MHDARGHYREISPRQQPITARDFTGSNLCHIIPMPGATGRRPEGEGANLDRHLVPYPLGKLDVFHAMEIFRN